VGGAVSRSIQAEYCRQWRLNAALGAMLLTTNMNSSGYQKWKSFIPYA